jgi:hypothetical protein
VDGKADAAALTPDQAAEVLRTLSPLQQQAVWLYVNHVQQEQGATYREHLEQQLKEQEQRLNADFLAELTKRTTPDEGESDDDLYASRDAVAQQVLQQAEQIDQHERHRELFAQQNDAALSTADVEQIAERVAHAVFHRLATPTIPVQGQHYVNGTTLPPPTPSFRRLSAYVPSTMIRR